MKKKIAIIGGSGRIGRHLLSLIYDKICFGEDDVSIVYYAPNNLDMIIGANRECQQSWMIGVWCGVNRADSNIDIIKPTSNIADIKDADAVIILAGKKLSKADYDEFEAKGINDRDAQSFVNRDMLQDIAENIGKYCSNAQVFVVTNQVDTMTDVVKMKLPYQQVYGLGSLLDSARATLFLRKKIKERGINVCLGEDFKLTVIGKHNKPYMHIGEFSYAKIKDQLPEGLMDEVLEEIRTEGLSLTNLNRNVHEKVDNNGAYVAPAKMVLAVILALLNRKDLEFAMARPLLASEVGREHAGLYAQMPCVIEDGYVRLLRPN